MENKASARVASRAIGTGSQFNSSKAMITRGNYNKAPQVPYTISKHIYEAIRDAESKLNLSSPAEGTNLANKEYEHNPSDSMKNRPCNVSRENETHLPRLWSTKARTAQADNLRSAPHLRVLAAMGQRHERLMHDGSEDVRHGNR